MNSTINGWKNNFALIIAYLAQLSFGDYIKRRLGYEIVGEGGVPFRNSYKLFPRNLPFLPYQVSRDPYVVPFQVEINYITSRVGFSYDMEGWHPFVETLKEYIKDPNIGYKNSTLAKLYNNYQPSSLQEVLLDDTSMPIDPLCNLPATNDLLRRIWTINQSSIMSHLHGGGGSSKEGWIFYGPHPYEYGEQEYKRLIDVYESIRRNGYRQELAHKDPVNGYFLKKNRKTRFVVLQGNHRLSVLQVLGYKEIDAVIRKGHPAIIAWEDLKKWTVPHGGIYTLPVAQHIFKNLFEGKGLEKARRHQLVN